MASIYQKTVTDKVCILSPREYILRPFDFGAWTEMRFGMYFNMVASSGDNTNCAAETVTLSTAADRFVFGIKDSDTSDLPGFGDALFLGASSYANANLIHSGNNQIYSNTGASNIAAMGAHETTLVGGATGQDLGNHLQAPLDATASSTYNGFWAVKLVITNLGLSSQSVAISSGGTSSISGTDYSADALRLDINNATYGTPVATAWNDGAVARDIPDAVFIRSPFYSNRIRLSAIRAIRYAP